MNIVLIGYRGSGKSTVGRRLSAHLNMRFVDIDDLIEERQGVPISDIVKSHGWGHFRKLERSAIEEISKDDRLIIAPGGGAVLDTDNVKAFKKNGFIIWLKADKQTLLKRLNQDPGTNTRRPTLTGKGTSEELKEVMSLRDPIYERVSEIQIDTSMIDVKTVVENILTVLKSKMGRIQDGREFVRDTS
jgi:shikimate kinase